MPHHVAGNVSHYRGSRRKTGPSQVRFLAPAVTSTRLSEGTCWAPAPWIADSAGCTPDEQKGMEVSATGTMPLPVRPAL